MDGPIASTTTRPCSPAATSSPAASTTRVETPGTGRTAQPGLAAVCGVPSGNVPEGANCGSWGRGEATQEPVSDCHQVSTNGTSPRPTCSRSHRQASGLMDSPTVPSRRIEDRFQTLGRPLGNAPMSERMSVGAV